jgi:hypothetical protein
MAMITRFERRIVAVIAIGFKFVLHDQHRGVGGAAYAAAATGIGIIHKRSNENGVRLSPRRGARCSTVVDGRHQAYLGDEFREQAVPLDGRFVDVHLAAVIIERCEAGH